MCVLSPALVLPSTSRSVSATYECRVASASLWKRDGRVVVLLQLPHTRIIRTPLPSHTHGAGEGQGGSVRHPSHTHTLFSSFLGFALKSCLSTVPPPPPPLPFDDEGVHFKAGAGESPSCPVVHLQASGIMACFNRHLQTMIINLMLPKGHLIPF